MAKEPVKKTAKKAAVVKTATAKKPASKAAALRKAAVKKAPVKKVAVKKVAVKKVAVKKAPAKAARKGKKNVSGYGSGSVDVVMSVDQVAREAASIAAVSYTHLTLPTKA